jgi:hypothetical protein
MMSHYDRIQSELERLLLGCTITKAQANKLHDIIQCCTEPDKTKVLDDGKTIEGKPYPGTAEDAYSAKNSYTGYLLPEGFIEYKDPIKKMSTTRIR